MSNILRVFCLILGLCTLAMPMGFAQASITPGSKETETKDGFVSVRNGLFIDSQGRQLLLHGICVINKNKNDHYLPWQGPEEFARLRQYGMNCIRLGILWDGLEPEPGKYDDAYLKQVDQYIQWAKDNNVFVFLDMHQDLFSVNFSDGAPEWATLTNNLPHITGGGVWSDAYFSSPAVQTAFDNFWANAPGPDGMGIQDRFALAWQHVAERYAQEPAVIGYDLLNEPNMGTQAPLAQMAMVNAFARQLKEKLGDAAPSGVDIVKQWGTSEGRSKMMEYLKDMRIYEAALDTVEPLYAEFDRTHLMPMYRRVAKAIRQADSNHILFLETSMASNMGVRSAIEPLTDDQGRRDPLQAYAPHGYDIVVDTPDQANASFDRIALIFARHAQTAQRLNMPMLVGEWGAYGDAGPDILPAARAVVRQFEKWRCGDTYWEYGKNVLQAAYRQVLQRPIPVRIAGELLSYQSSPEEGSFCCVWREDPTLKAPTCIYLPKEYIVGKGGWTVTPAGEPFSLEPVKGSDDAQILCIPLMGTAGERTLKLQL